MTRGAIVRSQNTGLPHRIHDVSGDRVMVRDEQGKLINHWFDKDFFSYGRVR